MNRKLVYIVNADWYFHLHWLERAKAAKESGLEVSVITPVTDPAISKNIEENGIKLIPWELSRAGRSIFKEMTSVKQLKRLLKHERPELVHCITVKPNVYTFFLSLFMRMKLVLSVTGLGMLFTSTKFIDRLGGVVVKNLYAFASRSHYIVFENNDDLSIIRCARFSKSKNLKRIMGAGVSSKDYVFQPIPELGGSLLLLFAARLLKPKGLEVLVEAVAKLNEAGYSVNLHVAGISDPDSPLSIHPDQIDKWSELSFFKFLGNRNDVPQLIADSHFVCLPSTYGEGIPRILIEAAAIGRPIITTRVPGCKEICEDGVNGFLVEPGDSESIFEALRSVFLEPNKIVLMSSESRSIFDRGYDNESVIKFTLGIYDKCFDAIKKV